MSLKDMVASSSEDTGQNPGLARLKSASSSGGIKAAEVAAPVIKGKFDKPKRETKSPSLERRKEEDGKLCDEDAIEAATPTQGLTQSLTQAMEVQLEDQAALDKQKHEKAVFGSDGNAVDDSWKEALEKEKSKRHDVEDSVDMLRKEQTEQRDDICKTMHVVGKLAAASLQNAEKSDGITIFVIKKKQQNTRSYFEAYKNLQKLVAENKKLVSAANIGPLVTVKVAGPEFIREALDSIKEWARKEAVEAAIFRGKNALTQMMELPIRSSHNALVKLIGDGDSRRAKEAGLATNWPDFDRKWSISMGEKVLVRGKFDLEKLEASVDINMTEANAAQAKQIKDTIRHFEGTDRFGSLFEICISNVDKFGHGSNWGRVKKGKGAGKGF